MKSPVKSLAARLFIARLVLAVLMLAAIGSYTWVTLSSYVAMQETEELGAYAELIHRRLEDLGGSVDMPGLMRKIDDTLVGSTRVHVVVETGRGALLYATSELRTPAWLREELNTMGGPGPMFGEWKAADGRRFRGAVGWSDSKAFGGQLAYGVVLDPQVEQKLLRRFALGLAAGLLLVLALAILASWLIDRVALRPLRLFAAAAARITPSRLSERIRLDTLPPDLHPYGETFNAMLARLEEAFARLSDFSSDLAHELRTPINNLMIQTQVTLASDRECADYQHTLESNLEELGRLSRMVSDMLFLARADASQHALSLCSVSLGAEAGRLLSLFEFSAEEKRIRLEASGDACVEADPTMVQRAINNLLSNALRHTPEGGRVTVRVVDAGSDGALVRVENDGPPIPPAIAARMFDRFYRAEASRQHHGEGAGLGLALVRSIMELHGGSVTMQREGELTTVFILRFARACPKDAGTLLRPREAQAETG